MTVDSSKSESSLVELKDVEECEKTLGYKFPKSFGDFLLTQNGQTGVLGSTYVKFYSVHELESKNYDDWKEFFPNTLRVGDTGALENFVINYDISPPRFGLLPHIGDKGDFIDLGTSWNEMIGRLTNDTVWDKLVQMTVNGKKITVRSGTTVAVATLNVGIEQFRISVAGESRGPLCGMGICFECRVTINGVKHQKSCTVLAENGMEVITDD